MIELRVAQPPAAEQLSMRHSFVESRRDVAAYLGNEPAEYSIEVGPATIGGPAAEGSIVDEVHGCAN